MNSSYIGAAKDLISACIDLQKLPKFIGDCDFMPPSFFMAIPGESAPLMTVLDMDRNNKVCLSIGRGYHSLDEEFSKDPDISALFFSCTIGTKSSLSDQALEWYDSIGYEPEGILYPEPLVYDDFFDNLRCPEDGEVICLLYAVKAVIELCKRGVMSNGEFREARPIVFVSGHPSKPLIGVGKEIFCENSFAEVRALPTMDAAMNELPVIDDNWTIGVKKLGNDVTGGQTVMVIEKGSDPSSCKKIPVNGDGLISLWKTLEILFSSGAMGEPGIPSKIKICHPGLMPMARTFIGKRVEVSKGKESDSMAVLLKLE